LGYRPVNRSIGQTGEHFIGQTPPISPTSCRLGTSRTAQKNNGWTEKIFGKNIRKNIWLDRKNLVRGKYSEKLLRKIYFGPKFEKSGVTSSRHHRSRLARQARQARRPYKLPKKKKEWGFLYVAWPAWPGWPGR
jgi:hypothetical protein